MKQLVRTSQGWIELDIERLPMSGDFSVRVAVFDGAGGWAGEEKTWNKWSRESVEALVGDVASIPLDEATQISAQALDEWRARGGEVESRGEKRKVVTWLVSVFGLATVGALAVLVAVVVVLVKVL